MTTPEWGKMTPDVAAAIKEVAAVYPNVDAEPDGDGGARVIVHDLPLAGIYRQRQTWCEFHVTYGYPSADVYPHFVRADLSRVDQASLGTAMSQGCSPRGSPSIQISRRSRRLNPATDTALLKLQKVLRWLNDRA